MESKLQRAIADLRVDVARNKGGLVRVFADQLTTVLDALEDERVLTVKVSPKNVVSVPQSWDNVIREGDRVVITDYSVEGNLRDGMEGTVKWVTNSQFPYRVLVDEALPYYPSGALFDRSELQKVV